MIDLTPSFAWFSQPATERDSAYRIVIKEQLVTLWGEVRDLIGPERFDPTLGSVRAGRFSGRSGGAWVQTNSDQDSDFINLTLELEADEFSLNVIGWYDPQLEKMERWLRHPAAWRFLRSLPDWLLVVFVRSAHIGADGKPVFQGAPGIERERIPFTATSPANISTRLTGLRPHLDPGREKLSLHIRRAWTAQESAELELSKAVASEVESWLQPIQDMRTA